MEVEHKDKCSPNAEKVKYFILFPGKTSKPLEDYIRNALKQGKKRSGLVEVSTAEECDIILVFCIIASRAGTDIDAAVNELNAHSESKRAVFMVLHHTFDPDKMVPDSSGHVTRDRTDTVDFLFYEDKFLECRKNQEALDKIKRLFNIQDTETETLNPSMVRRIFNWLNNLT